MKRIKRIIKFFIELHCENNDNYIPLYSGDDLLGYVKGGEMYGN